MEHIERFYATIERKPVDKPASWLGIPALSAHEGLFRYFRVSNLTEFKKKIDDDIFPVELPYDSPTSKAIYNAFDFAKKDEKKLIGRTLTTPGFFENYSEPSKVGDFDWPDPSKYINPAECERVVAEVPNGYVVLGVLWSAHFQDACAAFGMETALVKMISEPEIFRAVIDRILEFYLQANDIFYSNTKGKLHAVLLGNDFGSQRGLMISPALLREFVFTGIKKLVEQAKSYNLKVIYHSCGSIYDVIPDLIEAGVDAIHPIQALAEGMEPDKLKAKFGNKVSFCGGVDAQNLLVNGTPAEVARRVIELKNIFPSGLIVSPSHEAILPDIPPQNIEALFKALKI